MRLARPIVRQRARQQAAERRHADERHGVVTHHAAALVFRHDCLDDGVAAGTCIIPMPAISTIIMDSQKTRDSESRSGPRQ